MCIFLLLWFRVIFQHSYFGELQCVLSFSKELLLVSAVYMFAHMLEWLWEDGTCLLQGEGRVRRGKCGGKA